MVYYFWTLSRRDWLSWVSKTCLHWNQPGNILVKDHKQMWRRAQRYTCCLRGADDEARERRSCARPTKDKETVPWLVLRSPLKDGKDNEGTRNCSTYLTPVHIHGNSGGKILLPKNLIQDQVKVLHFSVPSVDSALSLMNTYKSPGVQQSLPTCSCISIFLLLWMWEPFTQLCTYSQVSSYMWASCRGQCLSQWWAHRKREDTLYSHSGHKFTWFKQLLVLNMLGMHMKLFLVLKLNITASSLRQQKLPTKPLTLGAMIFKIFNTRLQIFLYHFFSICWKTPLLGMRSVLWLLSSQWHAISQWVAHSSALKEYQRRISCARRCFSTLHPLNPNDFSTSSNVCI